MGLEPQGELIVATAAIKPELPLGCQGSGAIEIQVSSVIPAIEADDFKAIEGSGDRIAGADSSACAALVEDDGVDGGAEGEIVSAGAT